MMVIMEIKGSVATGYGKGAYFLGQKFYKSKFNEKCGFTPYPGTLNIVVPEKYLDSIKRIKSNTNNIIKPREGFGGVRYIKATLKDLATQNTVTGAIVFPDKTTHEENYLEFIAKENLRKKFNLKDEDEVKISIDEQ